MGFPHIGTYLLRSHHLLLSSNQDLSINPITTNTTATTVTITLIRLAMLPTTNFVSENRKDKINIGVKYSTKWGYFFIW